MPPKTRGLGENPLGTARGRRLPSVIPTGDSHVAGETAAAQAAQEIEDTTVISPAPRRTTKTIAKNKTQISPYIDIDVADDARNAVMALMSHPDGPRNLSDLANNALRNEVARLQEQFNDGQPFPQRRVQLQPGRPLSS